MSVVVAGSTVVLLVEGGVALANHVRLLNNLNDEEYKGLLHP